MTRAGGALLAAIVAVAALAGCGGAERPPAESAGEPALPASFIGVVSADSFAREGAYRRSQLRAQRAAGIGLLRQTFSWAQIETSPGVYELARYDAYVADAARAGIEVMPILFEPPVFHAQQLAATASPTTVAPPRDPAAMARWARVLVRRYGSAGSLWREHPELPRRPIENWQVWNEPNLPVYWNDRPRASEYVRLLRVVGAAIRDADAKARVVTAGLPESRLGTPFATYVRAMYAAGAQGTFDALAINAYGTSAAAIRRAVLGARRITAAAQDGDVPIWLTEFGWATPPAPRGSFTVSETRQGRLVAAAIADLAGERERLGIAGIVYYQWRDAAPYPGIGDFWGLHTGLLRRSGEHKPALARFTRAAARVLGR